MTNFKILFLISFILTALVVTAQDRMILSGKVLNQKTLKPIAYATIGVKGHPIGTTSNAVGEFEFFIPHRYIRDSLYVSHVGYKTFQERISNLEGIGERTIYLEESSLILDEVVVTGKELTAKEIVQQAAAAIPKVFPREPYILEGFHRSWEKIDFTDSLAYPGTLIEAAVSIYDPGFEQKQRNKEEELYLKEARRSNLMKGWNYGRGNFLRMLLKENDVRYNRSSSFVNLLKGFLDFPNEVVYEWDGMTGIDDENIYIIKVTVPNYRKFPASYKLYISEKDLAILRYDLYGVQEEIDSVWLASREWHPTRVEHTYIFKRYNNKPYLNYAKIQYQIKKSNRITRKIERTEDYFCELLVNDIITVHVEEQRKNLGPKAKEVSFGLQAGNYNEEFWANYNIILENPLDKEIILWFEEHEKLEEQFRNH